MFLFICSESLYTCCVKKLYDLRNIIFGDVRYEMLQDNVEGYRKEIASLREKDQKMATAAQKNEQIIHTLNEDLRTAKEKLAIAEVFYLILCFLVSGFALLFFSF